MNLVIIHLRRQLYRLPQSLTSLDSNFRMPPTYSQFLSERDNPQQRTTNDRTTVRFSDLVRSSLSPDLQVEPDVPVTCWLSALVSVQMREYADFFGSLQIKPSQRTRKQKSQDVYALGRSRLRQLIDDIWVRAEQVETLNDYIDTASHQKLITARFLCDVTDHIRRQVSGFERVCKGSTQPDFRATTEALDQLWHRIKELVETLHELLEIQHQKKTMIASEKAIEESRSAVAG